MMLTFEIKIMRGIPLTDNMNRVLKRILEINPNYFQNLRLKGIILK